MNEAIDNNVISKLEDQIETLTDRKEDLIAGIDKVSLELDDIKNQIEVSKIRAEQGDEPINPEWLHKVNRAKSFKKRELQSLQMELGTINKDIKRLHHEINESRLGSSFIRAAKEILDEELYKKLLSRALESSKHGV